MSVTVTVPLEGMAYFREQFKTYVERAVNSAVYRAQERAKELIPVRKRTWEGGGHLRESFYVSISGNMIKLNFPAEYAEIVEKGAGAHIIEAKGKALHWFDPVEHFAQKVFHPGFAGLHYVDKVRDFVVTMILEQLGFAMSELAARGY
jgi:hypothetical protein